VSEDQQKSQGTARPTVQMGQPVAGRIFPVRIW
jgi:hypothetical protein